MRNNNWFKSFGVAEIRHRDRVFALVKRSGVMCAALVILAAPAAHAVLVNSGFETAGAVTNTSVPGWTVSSGINNGIPIATYPPQTQADLGLATGGKTLVAVVNSPSGPYTKPDPDIGTAASFRWPLLEKNSGLVNAHSTTNFTTGGTNNGKNVTLLQQIETIAAADVDPSDGKVRIRFAIAPILENPLHTDVQQPYAFVEITNITQGNSQLYHAFYTAGALNVPWQTTIVSGKQYNYIPWQAIDVAYSPPALNLGDQVQVTIIAAGCSPGGHEGLIYVDSSPQTPGSGGLAIAAVSSANVIAPGAITYNLSYSNNSASDIAAGTLISVNPPVDASQSLQTFQSLTASPLLICTAPAPNSTAAINCTVTSAIPASTVLSNALQVTYNVASTAVSPLSLANYQIAPTVLTTFIGPQVLTPFVHSQAITFPAPGAQTFAIGGTFAVTATASSSLTVSFSSLTPAVCSVSGTTVTMLSGGTCTIAADQVGNTTYNAASQVTRDIIISAATSTTAITSSVNPSVFGQTVTFIATVTGLAPTGTVAFLRDGVTQCAAAALVGGGNAPTATCGTNALAVGTHGVVANYVPADNNNAASTANLNQTVNVASTTTSVTPASTSIGLGTSVSIGVTVAVAPPGGGTPSGTINVSDGGAGTGDTCTITLPAASCTLKPSTAGSAVISAQYSGDANFSGSNGAANVTVNKVATTTAISTGTLTYAKASVVSASVTPNPASGSSGLPAPAGTVTINDGLGGAGDSCIYTLPATGCSITPSGAGAATLSAIYTSTDQVYLGSNGSASVTVAQAPQTITFGSAPTIAVTGNGTVSATSATPNSGNPILFSAGPTSICSISGNTVIGIAVGTCTVTATQAADVNFAAGTATQVVGIGIGSQTIVFPTQSTPTQSFVSGGTFAIAPLATGGASGNPVTYTSTTPNVCSVSGTTVTMLAAGTCTIAAHQAGSADYAAATEVVQSVVIGTANSGIALTSSAPTSVFGQNVVFTATVTGQTLAGDVTFSDGATVLCNAVVLSGGGNSATATCATSALVVATHTINANYASADANNANASTSIGQQVNAVPIAVAVPTLSIQLLTLLAAALLAASGVSMRRRMS